MHVLAESTIATTVSILLVAFVRKPLRSIAGPGVAYWVWLLVPASNLATLLPAPPHPLGFSSDVFPPKIMTALSALPLAASSVSADGEKGGYAILGLSVVWILGAVVMLALMLLRQRAFSRALGRITPMPDGTYRSHALRGPVLVGLWRARIILPAGFEAMYDADERALVLVHERAHQRRLDIPLSAVASIWLCFSWFNPLVYWAIGRFRSDQELACDAVVLAEPGVTRRRYSDALLKAQLASDPTPPLATGCHWQSGHPLKERIVMISRPLPSRMRRISGSLATFALIVSGSLAMWAAQPTTAFAQTSYAQAFAKFEAGMAVGANHGSWSLIANRSQPLCHGEVDYTGNVIVKPAEPFPAQPDLAAETVTRRDDGSMLLQGAVRISFKDGSVLVTDRAVAEPDGTITMEQAHFSPGPESPQRPLWLLPCRCDARCRVIGVEK